MSQKKTPSAGRLLRSSELSFRAVEGQANQYEISFSSEEPYLRWDDSEILLHDAGSVNLERFAETGTLLFAHGRDPNYGKVPIGKVVRAWVDVAERKGRAVIEFDEEDADSVRLKSKLDRGMLNGVSVGYTVEAWLQLQAGQKSADGRFTGPAYIAAQWTPLEISLEPVPADPTVGYGKSLDNNEEEPTMSMKTEAFTPAAPAVADPPAAVAENAQRSATPPPATQEDPAAVERARVLEIGQLCRHFAVDDEPYIRNGDSVDAVRAAVLKQLAETRTPVAGGMRGDAVSIVRDEMDKVRAAATDGLLLRCGVPVEKPTDGAMEFRGMTLQSIAIECLTRAGVANAHRMTRDELLRRSMAPDSAFSAIAADVANRTVKAASDAAPTTYQQWTSKGSQTDFRPTDIYEISGSGELELIPQNGEFKEGKLGDAPVATRRLYTFGKKISFTRQLFINDDIDIVMRTLTAYTLAFQRGINKAVYEILRNNPTMRDGYALFSGEHGNLATGAAPSTAAFSEARKLMRKQKDLGEKVALNISPAYILTGSTDETAVEQLLASLADPSANNSGVANVFRNRMQPIVDAELDLDSGAQPYFFAADPRLSEGIEVSYLNGNEAPIVEMTTDFDTLGFKYRIYGDRGITLIGYRGLVKNPGTNE